jgi:hypothetical protein
MSDEVVVSKESVGLVAVVIGFLANIFIQGRKVGRIEESFKIMAQDVTNLKKALNQLQEEHNKDIASIEKWFRTDAGGQKFMTFPDHDLICNRNDKITNQAITQMTEAVKGLTTQVTVLGEQFHELKVSVAVLQASSSNGAPGSVRRVATKPE